MRTTKEREIEIEALRLARESKRKGGMDWWYITIQIIVIASDMPTAAINASSYNFGQKAYAHDARRWLDGDSEVPSEMWKVIG